LERFDVESIRILYEMGKVIRSGQEIDEKFQQILKLVKDVVRCHYASLFIYKDGALQEVATIGEKVDLIEAVDFDLGSGFSAWVAKNRRSVLIPSLRKDRADGFKSFISSPMISGEDLVGVINVGHSQPNYFTENFMRFLEVIAGQLADHIERKYYEQELLKTNQALRAAQREIEKQQELIIEMEKTQVIAQVAASINHEINNPLTTIIGNLELMLMIKPDMDTVIKTKLQTILGEAVRIGKIVEKLRGIKKIVTQDYISRLDEKMIDLDSSSNP